jgi:hypothetical protein
LSIIEPGAVLGPAREALGGTLPDKCPSYRLAKRAVIRHERTYRRQHRATKSSCDDCAESRRRSVVRPPCYPSSEATVIPINRSRTSHRVTSAFRPSLHLSSTQGHAPTRPRRCVASRRRPLAARVGRAALRAPTRAAARPLATRGAGTVLLSAEVSNRLGTRQGPDNRGTLAASGRRPHDDPLTTLDACRSGSGWQLLGERGG